MLLCPCPLRGGFGKLGVHLRVRLVLSGQGFSTLALHSSSLVCGVRPFERRLPDGSIALRAIRVCAFVMRCGFLVECLRAHFGDLGEHVFSVYPIPSALVLSILPGAQLVDGSAVFGSAGALLFSV